MRILIVVMGVLIAGVAVFLRTAGLGRQELFSYDEAYIVDRGETVNAFLFGTPVHELGFHYIDIKMLWLVLIAFTQTVFGDGFLAAKCLAGFLGIGSVGLTFLLAKRFCGSTLIGLSSAAFLAVSSYHVFYSRVPLPDVAVTTFVLLSFLYYGMAMKGKKAHAVFSGIFFGIAVLSHYRALVVGLYVFILEISGAFLFTRSLRFWFHKNFFRYPAFLVSAIVAVAGFVIWEYHFLGISHAAMVTYYGVTYYDGLLQWGTFSLLPFPYYFWKMEGAVVCVLLIISLFCIRRRPVTGFFVVCALLQVLFASLVVPRIPRGISFMLPFFLSCPASPWLR